MSVEEQNLHNLYCFYNWCNLQKLSECRVGIWPTPYVSQSTAWFLLRVGTPTAALVFPISLLRDLWIG